MKDIRFLDGFCFDHFGHYIMIEAKNAENRWIFFHISLGDLLDLEPTLDLGPTVKSGFTPRDDGSAFDPIMDAIGSHLPRIQQAARRSYEEKKRLPKGEDDIVIWVNLMGRKGIRRFIDWELRVVEFILVMLPFLLFLPLGVVFKSRSDRLDHFEEWIDKHHNRINIFMRKIRWQFHI